MSNIICSLCWYSGSMQFQKLVIKLYLIRGSCHVFWNVPFSAACLEATQWDIKIQKNYLSNSNLSHKLMSLPLNINIWRSKQRKLLLLLMPCPFTGPNMFCASPNFLCRTKNLFTNILCQNKRWFAFSKIGFCAGTKVFEEAVNAIKFLV